MADTCHNIGAAGMGLLTITTLIHSDGDEEDDRPMLPYRNSLPSESEATAAYAAMSAAILGYCSLPLPVCFDAVFTVRVAVF